MADTVLKAFDVLERFDSQLSDGDAWFLASHEMEDGSYESYKIALDTIVSQLIASLPVKSAAYAQSSEFALSAHDHDIYTSAEYHSFVDSSSDKTLNVLSMSFSNPAMLCTMAVSAVTSQFDGNVYSEISMSLPKLGTVQMMGVEDLTSYSYTSERFLGWVPAVSTTEYPVSAFIMSSSISDVFSTSGTESTMTFRVPSLTSFSKIFSDSTIAGSSYELCAGTAVLPVHTHTLNAGDDVHIKFNSTNISTDQNISAILSGHLGGDYQMPRIDFTVKSGKLSVNFPYRFNSIHGGVNSLSGNHAMYSESTQTINNYSLDGLGLIASDGVTDEAPYPPHNLMPALVYVGPSKYSVLSSYVVDIA